MADSLVMHTRVVTGAGGGPEKTIINSPRFLQDEGFPMVCAYMRSPDDSGFGALLGRAAEKGASIVPVDDNGALDWRIVRRFAALCREYRPVIWHAHDYKSNFVGWLLRKRYGLRLITTAHGYVTRDWKLPIYYALDRRVLQRYEHVVCVSQDLHDHMLGIGIAEHRCTHIPNGIDTDEFRRSVASAERKPSFATDPRRLVVGAVGRLSAEKGFDLLIEAFAHVIARSGVDAELWIAGDGEERDNLARQVAALGLADRVRLLGFCADTVQLFEAMDVFVLSSRREGLPNVVLEALAMEVPVLCTRIAGVPTVVTDGDNGILVDPGSTQALEEPLQRLLDDGSLRRRLAIAGRRRVEDRHSFSLRMSRIKAVYEQVLSLPAPA